MRDAFVSVIGFFGMLAALWVWCLVGAICAPASGLWHSIGLGVVSFVLR